MNSPRPRSGPSNRHGRVKLRLVDLNASPASETGTADNWLLLALLASACIFVVAFVMRFF